MDEQSQKQTKPHKLSLKQKHFIKEYTSNGGNATQAALKVYDVDTIQSAQVIGHNTINKPQVKEAIETILQKKGLTLDAIADNIKSLASAEVERISGDTKLKANVELLKLYNAYPDKKSYQFNMSLKGKIKDLSYNEVRDKLKELDQNINGLEDEEVN